MSPHLEHTVQPDLAGRAMTRTSAPAAHEHVHTFEWSEMLRILLVAFAATAVWFRFWEPLPSVSVMGVAGLLIGGWPIFREALESVAAKRMTIELSKNGRASSRERVCKYVYISVVAVSLKNKTDTYRADRTKK